MSRRRLLLCCCSGGPGPGTPITDCDDLPAATVTGTGNATLAGVSSLPLALNLERFDGADGCVDRTTDALDTSIDCAGSLRVFDYPLGAGSGWTILAGRTEQGTNPATYAVSASYTVRDCGDDSLVSDLWLRRTLTPYTYAAAVELVGNAGPYLPGATRTFTVGVSPIGGLDAGSATGSATLVPCTASPDPVADAAGELAAVLTVTASIPCYFDVDLFDADGDNGGPFDYCDPGSPCSNQSERTLRGPTPLLRLRYYLPLTDATVVSTEGFPLGEYELFEVEPFVDDATGFGSCPSPTVAEFVDGYWHTWNLWAGGPSFPSVTYPATVVLAA